jgi:hypothetical protein
MANYEYKEGFKDGFMAGVELAKEMWTNKECSGEECPPANSEPVMVQSD